MAVFATGPEPMQASSAGRLRSAGSAWSSRLPGLPSRLAGMRVPMVRALAALILLAVLSTAVAVHLIWRQAAGQSIDRAIVALDAGAGASVKRALSDAFAGAEAVSEIIRSALFQGTIDANDEAKREFLFLSVLRSQPAISWIGFGFPDGRFFGAHASPGRIEMVEIGAPKPGIAASLRRDVYSPLPGDIFFEERLLATSEYVMLGSAWYRAARTADKPVWTTVDILPNGFEPAAVASVPVTVHGEFIGVAMVAVAYRQLDDLLGQLDIASAGRAFVLGGGDLLVASSARGERSARLADNPGPYASCCRPARWTERLDLPAGLHSTG